MARSRNEARQIVRHGHVLVNGRQVNIPSFQVEPGREVSVAGTEKMKERWKKILEEAKDQKRPEWLEFNDKDLTAKIKKAPTRADIQMPIQEQLIVELYSK